MGSWFSNIHIKNNRIITLADVLKHITEALTLQQYVPSSAEEADVSFAIVSNHESQWISVYSDLFDFEDPASFSSIAKPMSAAFSTDILGISCFDSDYLFLNLINTADQTDGWIGVGSAAGLGIKRRTNLSVWKTKVTNFPVFQESVRRKYVFAEEVLAEIAPCLSLPQIQSSACFEYLSELNLSGSAEYLYFKLPAEKANREPPRLVQCTYSLRPCSIGLPSIVSALNEGGASKGLSVYFLGPYVEHDEITISDVSFLKQKNGMFEAIPFTLNKVQLSDGQWAYHYHDPNLQIPPKVDERLPERKRALAENANSIIVRFIPQGNSRKLLDISVVLVPDENPAGQTCWNVWMHYGSKEAFMEAYSMVWKRFHEKSGSSSPEQMPLCDENND